MSQFEFDTNSVESVVSLNLVKNMILLMQAGTEAVRDMSNFPVSAVAVYVVGFIAAVTLGSIAWYNSKRPPGWEDKERPPVVPEVPPEETPGLGEPRT
jgi:hypothetical protein